MVFHGSSLKIPLVQKLNLQLGIKVLSVSSDKNQKYTKEKMGTLGKREREGFGNRTQVFIFCLVTSSCLSVA